jgi:hypothetical protein
MSQPTNEPQSMAADSEKIWRYMDLAKFVSFLSKEALYFACPCEFVDPYEGAYPKSHVQAFSSMAQQCIEQMRATRDELVARCGGQGSNLKFASKVVIAKKHDPRKSAIALDNVLLAALFGRIQGLMLKKSVFSDR